MDGIVPAAEEPSSSQCNTAITMTGGHQKTADEIRGKDIAEQDRNMIEATPWYHDEGTLKSAAQNMSKEDNSGSEAVRKEDLVSDDEMDVSKFEVDWRDGPSVDEIKAHYTELRSITTNLKMKGY